MTVINRYFYKDLSILKQTYPSVTQVSNLEFEALARTKKSDTETLYVKK